MGNVVFLLFSIVVLVDSTPQFGFGGFGGFGFGLTVTTKVRTKTSSQNCAGSQCNQNNFGKEKREVVQGEVSEDDLGVTKSEALTHLLEELNIPNVDKNVPDTNTEEAEEQVSPVMDDKVDISAVLGTVEDGGDEALVEEVEEERDGAEEVLDSELETILESGTLNSEAVHVLAVEPKETS